MIIGNSAAEMCRDVRRVGWGGVEIGLKGLIRFAWQKEQTHGRVSRGPEIKARDIEDL